MHCGVSLSELFLPREEVRASNVYAGVSGGM